MNVGERQRVLAHPQFSRASDHKVSAQIAREIGVPASEVRALAVERGVIANEDRANDGRVRGHVDVVSAKSSVGFGATTTGVGGPMGARIAELSSPGAFPEMKEKAGFFATIASWIDGTESGTEKRILKDGKVTLPEIFELVHAQRDLGGITKKERDRLIAFLDEHAAKMEPPAHTALVRFLELQDPNARPTQPESSALKDLWKSTKTSWPAKRSPPASSLTDAQKLEQAKAIFSTTVAEGRADAKKLDAFFDAYPSIGAQQVVAFHSQWATFETLDDNPLQAFNYRAATPFDENGAPKNELWRAYTTAVETGAPPAVVEEAYLRAHIADFKDILRDPTFGKLYDLATPWYQGVVDAYVETLGIVEKKLDDGKDPVSVSRGLTVDTGKRLLARGTLGMIWTKEGMKNLLNFSDPITKQMWGGYWNVFKSSVLRIDPPRPQAVKVAVELSPAEAKELKDATGLDLKPGKNVLTKEMFANASFAEPDRRVGGEGPLKRYPLKLEDFTEMLKLRPGMTRAGTDGVYTADEMRAVLRDLQGRVRSQLIQDFQEKYPVPIGGLLVYSANMLAMNQTYGEHAAYAMVPNYIMPVDNDGKPKGPFWQAFVDKYESHKKTGLPSFQEIERAWFVAHMEDFKGVDNPEFRTQVDDFWNKSLTDPTLAPLAIYLKAGVGGRDVFELAKKENLTEEQALVRSMAHFGQTMFEARSFPFWQQDLKELGKLAFDKKFRDQPDKDDRGLASDAALVKRSLSGIKDLFGIMPMLWKALEQTQEKTGQRIPTDKMLDITSVLSPADAKKVDPLVIGMYANPTNFDVKVGVEFNELNRFMIGNLGAALSGMGDVPDRERGFEKYPMEMQLYRDPQGGVHWDRDIVVDGKKRTLFHAKFEVENGQVKETFRVRGTEVALYFDVTPYKGGVKLSLDPKKSSPLARCSDITFTSIPDGKGGVEVSGLYHGKDAFEHQTGEAKFFVTPKG